MVDGLRSTSIKKRLLSEGDIPLSKAYGIAISLETANKEASSMQALPSDAVKQVVHVLPAQKPPCYRCGKPGHSPHQYAMLLQEAYLSCQWQERSHSQGV